MIKYVQEDICIYSLHIERWIIVPKLPKYFIAPVPMILSQFKHVHGSLQSFACKYASSNYGQYKNTFFLTSPLSISLVQPLLYQYPWFNPSLTSPISISFVQSLLYQYLWLNLSFINIFGSTSPLSKSLVQPLLCQYPWFDLSFINILSLTSPLSISLFQPLLYQYPWFNLSFINIFGSTSSLSISLV